MTTNTLFNDDLTKKIMEGVDILANAVGTTLGCRGRTVILKSKNQKQAIITKDGITVAKHIVLGDPFQDIGVSILRQASESTLNKCGDGTSTAIVLSRAIYKNAIGYLNDNKNTNINELKRGIETAAEEIIKLVEEYSKPVKTLMDIENIATISANGDRNIGKLIALAIDKIGNDGAITIQESKSNDTSVEISEGFSFDSGLLANAFINDDRREVCRFEDCLVFVTSRNMNNIEDLKPIMELAVRDTRPLVVIAEQVENSVLSSFIYNTVKGTIKMMVIKPPRYGEERRDILSDIALTTGATFISADSGIPLKSVSLKHLGTAKIVESGKYTTTIVSNNADPVKLDNRIQSIKAQIMEIDNITIAKKLQERITRLASAIAIIKVGGATEVEMIEKKHRIEDALESVNSAQDEGVVAGGGTALIKASMHYTKNVDKDREDTDFWDGTYILTQAIKAPFNQMLSNACMTNNTFIHDLEETMDDPSWGVNILTGELCNMIEQGIIDPTKVVKHSLKNAVSAAAM